MKSPAGPTAVSFGDWLKQMRGRIGGVGALFRRIFKSLSLGVILFFFLVLSGIIIAAAAHRRAQVQRTFHQHELELAEVADLKVKQIVRWRIEREGDALVIGQNVAIARQVADCFIDQSRGPELRRWVELMCTHNGYSGATLVDSQGVVRMSFGKAEDKIDPQDRRLVQEVRRQKEITLSDLYLDETSEMPVASLVIPMVMWDAKGSPVVGVFIFRIDPQAVLYPLLQTWPTPSKSSETLLIRREGDEVVFLNELRHRKDSALRFRLPMTRDSVPSVLAARGFEGNMEGIDYRGVPVLASIKKIPGSPWSLIAKVDREEVDETIRDETWTDGIVALLLIVATTASIGFWWRHQRVIFFRSQFQAEQERLALVQHFEYLVRYANDIIILADKALKIVEVNDRGLESYGYSKDEIIGLNVIELESKETASIFPEQIKTLNVYRGGRYESVHRRKDGTLFPVEVSTRIIELEGAIYYQLIARNITERKRADEALRESEFWIKESQRVGQIGSYIFDFQKGTFTSSTIFDEIFGIDDTFSRSVDGWLKCVHPDQRDEMLRYFANDVIAESHPFDKEYRIIRVHDGVQRWVWGLGELSYDSTGILQKMVGTIQDITDRKGSENEIRRLNAELELRVRDRTAQLETANRELEAFSYSVSHDLRAPLRGIDGWSLALKEDYASSLDDHANDYIHRIRAEAQRMGTLIDDLLQLSRVTRAGLSIESVDLSYQAGLIASRLKEMFPNRQIEFNIEENLTAQGDPHLLEIALTNLLDNACKFTSTRANAKIDFGRLSEEAKGAYFVRDNGVGFDLSYAKKLFGAFQRMHKSSEFPGTGIGLATVQRIIHRHAGRVWADAQVGRGATFFFTLPEGL